MIARMYPAVAKEFKEFTGQDMVAYPGLRRKLDQLQLNIIDRCNRGELSSAWCDCLVESIEGIVENGYDHY